MTARPPTPPNHPTYNVRFSDATIKFIIARVLPPVQVEKIEQLASGKSFNNRIYFISVREGSNGDESPETPASQDLVLKVCGQFWSATKVQNEVSCVSLLQHYCSQVPAPKLLAWSEDGKRIQLSGKRSHERIDCPSDEENDTRSWVLMTRTPGRVVTAADLGGPYGNDIMRQLASFAAQWRHNLPAAKAIGNLKFPNVNGTLPPNRSCFAAIPQLVTQPYIDGTLVSGAQPTAPISTPCDLYKFRLEAQLASLRTQTTYAPNRALLSDRTQAFIDKGLEGLALFQLANSGSREIVFTHYDLSPRNILISDDGDKPPAITGIIDLEFAGFFPEEEEFTNTMVNGEGDWPEGSYQVFLNELERLGVRTPLSGMGKSQEAWEQACALVKVTENLAPWWLSENSGMSGQELEKELHDAAKKVEEGLLVLLKPADKTN